MKKLKTSACLTIVALALTAFAAGAAPSVFTVDSAQSRITISGTVANSRMVPQDTGSLETRYEGSLHVELGANTIQFLPPSRVDAMTNGIWYPGPGGSDSVAPGDYGAIIETAFGDVNWVLRNVIVDITSGPVPLAAGAFDSSALLFTLPENSGASQDYRGIISGSETVENASTNRIGASATFSTSGSTQTITIPIDAEFTFEALAPNDSKVRLAGQLVATRALSAPAAFTGIEKRDNTVILTAAVPAPNTYTLQSSADLTVWGAESIVPETPAPGVAKYTVPASSPARYFRLIQP